MEKEIETLRFQNETSNEEIKNLNSEIITLKKV